MCHERLRANKISMKVPAAGVVSISRRRECKYIPSSVLKTSEFPRVLGTRENSDVFNSQDEIYFIPRERK